MGWLDRATCLAASVRIAGKNRFVSIDVSQAKSRSGRLCLRGMLHDHVIVMAIVSYGFLCAWELSGL